MEDNAVVHATPKRPATIYDVAEEQAAEAGDEGDETETLAMRPGSEWRQRDS